MKISRLFKSAALGLVLSLGSALPSHAISIIWNYDYDTNGFFTEERKLVLAQAAAQFDHLKIDSPDLPHPTEDETYWNWNIINPSTGVSGTYIPGNLQAGTVTIYVGAYDIGGTILGRGGPAGSSAVATEEWGEIFDTLNTPAAFKPYAGTLSITTSSDFTWYSGLSADVPDGQVDLYSVVLHELGHVFGIGINVPAWASRIDGNGFFVGEHVMELLGHGVELNFDGSHLEMATWEGNPLLMHSGLLAGERYEWSALETALLLDLGYVAIPEPATIHIALASFGLLLLVRRRTQIAA